MACEQCNLQGQSRCVFPSGSPKPDYYVLGDMATQQECDSNQVFTIALPANQYLMNTLYSLDMNAENTRMFKVVRCNAKVYDENINEASRQACGVYAMMDIFKTKPKIIITLGKDATRFLLKDRFSSVSASRGRIYDIEINGEIFKVLPTYAPNFIVNNSDLAGQFSNDLQHARSYVNGELVDIAQKDLQYAIDYKGFKKYYDEKLVTATMPAYDLETNAREPRSDGARMVGFSLAPDSSTGIYIVRESLEYRMPENDWEQICSIVKPYLVSRTLLVHNCMYEIPFTLNEWETQIEDFEDSLIKARLLLGGKTGAGLKDQCILNLGYPDWDYDLGEYKSAFQTLLKKLKPTSGGKERWDYKVLRDRQACELLEVYSIYLESGEGLDDRSRECYEALVTIRDIMLKYYTDDADYSIIMELIGDEIIHLIDIKFDGPFSYGFIPMKVISKYGAMDAVGTQDLNTYLDKKMEEYSEELNIDLKRGYKYMKRHFIAGTRMELAGMYWNDEVAKVEQRWCEDECLKSALNMIDSHFLDEHLLSKQKWIFNDYIVENQMEYVRQTLGDFKIMKSCIKFPDGRKIKWKEILDSLGEDFYKHNRELALRMIREKARTYSHYTDVKYFFNPASTRPEIKELINSILITNEIKIAHFMSKLNVMVGEASFNIEKYPLSDRKLFQVLIDCQKYNKFVDEYNSKLDDDSKDDEILDQLDEFESAMEDLNLTENFSEDEDNSDGVSNGRAKRIKLTTRDTYDKFVEILQNTQIKSQELEGMVTDSLRYQLESVSEGAIIELHKYYIMIGVDLDDLSTWTDRFKFLYSFRVWKKCNKMTTTYIIGKRVGRGSVWMVPTDDLQSGETLTRRRRKYDYYQSSDESCLMQATFGVCTAETLRWRAGMHTIPAESAIKNIYTSRYVGGSIAAPDFSQLELRVCAGLAKCTPMIDAFLQGADIHMENACKIFRTTPENITPAQRRYAKMASFMILYGGDYRNFGEEFLDGDTELAKFIYDSFYEAFPEIKIWIDQKHEEMRKTGKVTTIMDTFINVSPELFKGDENKALRAAQNYPVQHSGSMMGGCVLYEIQEFIKRNNYKSKIELFVHDSIEIDIHPDELLPIALQIIPLMNKFPMDEFGIPTSCDLVIGRSIGQEIVTDNIIVSEEYNEGYMNCEGYEDDFDDMIAEWRKYYHVVEYVDIKKPKPVYQSYAGAFVPKKAISKYYGHTRTKIERRVHLINKADGDRVALDKVPSMVPYDQIIEQQ